MMKVLHISNKLENTDNKILARFGNPFSDLSKFILRSRYCNVWEDLGMQPSCLWSPNLRCWSNHERLGFQCLLRSETSWTSCWSFWSHYVSNPLLNLFGSHHDNEILSEPDALTNGFCFINNVAVAAGYLKNHYRD